MDVDRVVGRPIDIDVDGADALDPDFRHVRGAIRQVVLTAGNFHLLVVHPAEEVRFSGDFVVEEILLIGIDMDLVTELFGNPQRPPGLPVLAAIWRVKDFETMISRVEAGKAPAPSEEYLGRGEVSLAA
jgi:hypothetical protein